MNEKNFEYLKKLLDNLGFGTRLNGVLQQALEKGFNTFTLGLNNSYLSEESRILGTPNKDIVKYRLNFAKSKNSDSVFLNDYQVFLFKPLEITPRSHAFDLERDHRITALQAYRLLSGFSIQKDVFLSRREGIEPNEAQPESKKLWLKINLDVIDAYEQHPLRKFYPEYGYDLGASIDKYPFTNLSSGPIREMALQDLAKGKLFKTEMRLFDQVFPVYVAANPQSRSLEIYDKALSRISDRQIFPDKIEKLESGARQADLTKSSDLPEKRDHPWDQDSDHDNLPKIGR
ncbi:hypothetical protein DU508_21745 [Pedobacter chinensis]|uniref:Uncharacterized protein n=1 Tax=Pedobacter chinensis TaxID=2282421 RepID=A0A369PW61_9SPHI|nr:hypothetical protein [Pedobacter chinensis]RDC54348.1 hypothetical protein DU508_21745 [Pedobacter chinensis]